MCATHGVEVLGRDPNAWGGVAQRQMTSKTHGGGLAPPAAPHGRALGLGVLRDWVPGVPGGSTQVGGSATPGSSWALRRRGTECEAAGVQRSMRASVQGRRVKDERWGDIAVRYRWQGCRGRRIRDAVL